MAIATGIAILRYRLYEIDVILRKTLVYATLIGVLAVVYLGGIYLIERALQAVTGQSGALAVTFSTLAVAAGFQPLRSRIRRGSIIASTAAAMTQPRRWRGSPVRCVTRSSWMRSPPTCWMSSRSPCSRLTQACG